MSESFSISTQTAYISAIQRLWIWCGAPIQILSEQSSEIRNVDYDCNKSLVKSVHCWSVRDSQQANYLFPWESSRNTKSTLKGFSCFFFFQNDF